MGRTGRCSTPDSESLRNIVTLTPAGAVLKKAAPVFLRAVLNLPAPPGRSRIFFV